MLKILFADLSTLEEVFSSLSFDIDVFKFEVSFVNPFVVCARSFVDCFIFCLLSFNITRESLKKFPISTLVLFRLNKVSEKVCKSGTISPESAISDKKASKSNAGSPSMMLPFFSKTAEGSSGGNRSM